MIVPIQMSRHRRLLLALAIVCCVSVFFFTRRDRGGFAAEILARLRAEGFPVTFDEIQALHPYVLDELNAFAAIGPPTQRIEEDLRPIGTQFDSFARLLRGVEPSPEWRAVWIPALDRNRVALASLRRGLSLPQSWDGSWVTNLTVFPPVLIAALLLRAEIESAGTGHRTGLSLTDISIALSPFRSKPASASPAS